MRLVHGYIGGGGVFAYGWRVHPWWRFLGGSGILYFMAIAEKRRLSRRDRLGGGGVGLSGACERPSSLSR